MCLLSHEGYLSQQQRHLTPQIASVPLICCLRVYLQCQNLYQQAKGCSVQIVILLKSALFGLRSPASRGFGQLQAGVVQGQGLVQTVQG